MIELVGFSAAVTTVAQSSHDLHAGIADETWTLSGMSLGLEISLLTVGTSPTSTAVAACSCGAARWCASDMHAMAVLAAAGERGLAVPRDLSVIGFDDSLLAALSSPALTSVRVDYAEFGAAATAALLASINGSEPATFIPSAPALEVRASTAPPRRRNVKI